MAKNEEAKMTRVFFYNKQGARKNFTVKNLGWLLRNWKKIKDIQIDEVDRPSLRWMYECRLVAFFEGGFYETYFTSRHICRLWLRRPVFRGLKLSWYRSLTTCDGE